MTVRVYLSTDASAPSLANSQNSLAALLYACLVTGYGAKSGLGWTREFTGTGKAVFKPGTGSKGHILRIDDDVAGGSYQYANMTIGRTATAVDTVLDGMTTAYRWYKLLSATGTPALYWFLCGTERGFYFGTLRDYTNNLWTIYYCGELISAYDTVRPDLWPMVLWGSSANDYDWPHANSTLSASAQLCTALGGPDGTFYPVALMVTNDNNLTPTNNRWPGPQNELSVHSRSIFYGTEANQQVALRNNGGPVFKGRLPGSLWGYGYSNFEDARNYPEFTVTNGFKTSAQYKCFRTKYDVGGSFANLFFLEISNTWEI